MSIRKHLQKGSKLHYISQHLWIQVGIYGRNQSVYLILVRVRAWNIRLIHVDLGVYSEWGDQVVVTKSMLIAESTIKDYHKNAYSTRSSFKKEASIASKI
jgi:hypothetical protein